MPSAVPGAAGQAAAATIACALGDLSGDGIADLLVLVADPTSGVQRLQALAGPGFEAVLWEKASRLGQLLRCAPDLDVDGVLDPLLTTVGESTGTVAAGATDQTRQQVQQVISGASGVAMLGRAGAEQVTGVAASTAAGAARQATSTLLPAAAGAAAYLQTEVTTGLIPLPGGLPLPVGAVSIVATASAQLQILDAAGAVVSTISIDQAGVQPLAMAPLALMGGLPEVAVLSSAVSPLQQAAAGVPELALYAADGALAWSVKLPASPGLPILLPQAGDLDLDGVGDLIVATIEQGVETAPSAAYQVLSGVDGHLLFDSGAAVTGLMTALPLGQLPGGAAILQVTSLDEATSLSLTALDGAGSILWSVNVDRLAVPINAALDVHTGDVTGFTDLTGDAVPDIAVAVQQGSALALQAFDGITGEIAWTASIPGAGQVIPVAIAVASARVNQTVGAAGAVAATVQDVRAGATSALLAFGAAGSTATLVLIDATTGAVAWTANATLATGAAPPKISASAAGDLDGDGTQDLLVTASYGDAAASTARSGTTRSLSSSEAVPPSGSVSAVSGATGESLYVASAAPSDPAPLEFESDFVATNDAGGDSQAPSNGIPAPGLVVLVLAMLAGTMWRRRRD